MVWGMFGGMRCIFPGTSCILCEGGANGPCPMDWCMFCIGAMPGAMPGGALSEGA